MPTPISSSTPARTQTINMEALTLPPPRTPAAGGAAPPRGPSPVRDEFSARPSNTNAAQGASAVASNPRAQLRADLESARRSVEQIPLPAARRPSVPQPQQTLAEMREEQHNHAALHSVVDGVFAALGGGSALGGHHVQHAVERALVGPHFAAEAAISGGARGHLSPGEVIAEGLVGVAADVLDQAMGAQAPLVGGAWALLRANGHILHDGHERARVAGEESAYRAAQAEVAQQDAYSRMDGENAGNGIGNPNALTRLDMGRLHTDRAYAMAVRQTIDTRIGQLPR